MEDYNVTVKELKSIARNLQIPRYTSMNKRELIQSIEAKKRTRTLPPKPISKKITQHADIKHLRNLIKEYKNSPRDEHRLMYLRGIILYYYMNIEKRMDVQVTEYAKQLIFDEIVIDMLNYGRLYDLSSVISVYVGDKHYDVINDAIKALLY